MNCQDVAELLGAYALDAVDSDEADQIARHIQGCPRCAGEVAAHRDTIGLLANMGGAAPVVLWDGIASRISGSAQPEDSKAPAVPPVPRVLTSSRSRPSRRGRLASAAAAAVALTLFAVQTAQVNHLDHRIDQLSAAARQTGGFHGPAAAMVDPSTRRLTLNGTSPGAGPAGQLLIETSGAAFLVDAHLPALPDRQAYQLWSFVDGHAISLGVLGSHPTTAAFSVDSDNSTTAYMLTVEPAGGVVAPTGPPIAQAGT